ncbi:MAG TPA: putative zinc-binding metallopeptidase [Gemmatales bacterium]|nr:putative zinc-binding metallopeptidase [Gemmatales bacterium]
MFLLATILLTVCWLPNATTKVRAIPDDANSPLESQLRQLERDYGFELEMVGPGYKPEKKGLVIDAKPVEGDVLAYFLPMFVKEMQLYPRELTQKAKLKRIFFCSDLYVNGVSAGGVALEQKDTIIYSLNSEVRGYTLTQLLHNDQSAIHHEFFHIVDSRINRNITVDAKWSELNVPGYRYGTFALNDVYERMSTIVTNRFPGFISRYAQMNVAEDKAETFSRMMLNLHEMECRAKDDPILGRKIDRIKQMLQEFSPEMDERFWTKIRNLKRPRLTLKGKEDPWADAHPILPPLPKEIEAVPKVVEPVVVIGIEPKWILLEQPCVTIRRR